VALCQSKTGLCTVLLAWAVSVAALHGQQYRFRHYGNEDGLTNLAVKVMFQDRTGFLWASTENGLFRFDGHSFKSYGTAEGLPREVTLSLGEAPDGSVLAGTRSGLYQQKGEHFEKAPLPGSAVIGAYNSILYAGNGQTYVATNRGLFVTQAGGGSGLSFRLLPAPSGVGNDAHGLLAEPDAVWYGCGASLCRIGKEGTVVYGEVQGLPPGRWNCIRRTGGGDLWVGDKRRFVVMRRGKQRFETVVPRFPAAAGSDQFEVDSEGRFMLPTIEGVAILEGTRLRMIGSREGLRGAVAYSVLQDRDGAVWVGLGGRGLDRWAGYDEWEGFTQVNGLDSELIYEILPVDDGNLWIGTEDGLFCGRKQRGRWLWRRDATVGRIPIHSIRQDRDGCLWLGTEGFGLGRLNSHGGHIEWFKNSHGLSAESPVALALDSSQRLWAGTEAGLFVTQLPNAQFRRVEEVGKARCWTVAAGPDGQILAGGEAGLFRLAEGRWRHLTKADGLIDNTILSVIATRADEFWVGYWYSGQLSRVSVKGDRLVATHYGREQNVRGEMTYFLGLDASGRLWSGTNEGVRVWDGAMWTHYDQNDGLIWNDCDLGAFAAQPDGSVWIGTSGGLAHYRPRRTGYGRQPTTPIFTRLMLGNRVVDAGRHVAVNYRANSLTAQYSALAFAHEDSILFRYRLIPLFSDWRETALHEMQFPGLPANDYRLELESRDWAGQWSEQPAVFAFKIEPAWWFSWWACGLAGVAAMATARAIWRWRNLQLLNRHRELEQAVAERTLELQRDKQELMAAREALEEQAVKDGLTGLFNHGAFFDVLEREFARIRRQGGALAFIMADLDWFKKINDTYGHLAGDTVLRDCARRIVAAVRPYDSVGRYGGEEFAILMPECRLEEAAERAEQVRQTIGQEPVVTPAGAITVTCSLGVSATGRLVSKPEELVQSADLALYRAKALGRNCVVVSPKDQFTRAGEMPEASSR